MINKTGILNYLQHPDLLDSHSITELQTLINEFPYFQTAHLLLIKNLRITKEIVNSFQLSSQLSSAYITDRSKLYDIIFDRNIIEKEISEDIQNSGHRKLIRSVHETEDCETEEEVIDISFGKKHTKESFSYEDLLLKQEESEQSDEKTKEAEAIKKKELEEKHLQEETKRKELERIAEEERTRLEEEKRNEADKLKEIEEKENKIRDAQQKKQAEIEKTEAEERKRSEIEAFIKKEREERDKIKSDKELEKKQEEERIQAEREQIEKEKQETDRLEKLKAEKEIEEKLAEEKREQERQENEYLESKKREQEIFEKEQLEAQRIEQEKLEAEKNTLVLENNEQQNTKSEKDDDLMEFLEDNNENSSSTENTNTPEVIVTKEVDKILSDTQETPKEEVVDPSDSQTIADQILKQVAAHKANKKTPKENTSSENTIKTEPKVNKKQKELISNFIKKTDVIEPIRSSDKSQTKKEDVSKKSIEDDLDIVTETLAKIYIKQGHYKRAMEAYEKLSLKIPEKSTYFAAEIENLKTLMEEKKTE